MHAIAICKAKIVIRKAAGPPIAQSASKPCLSSIREFDVAALMERFRLWI